jgi:Ca2+-binding RTX toxin-like protein
VANPPIYLLNPVNLGDKQLPSDVSDGGFDGQQFVTVRKDVNNTKRQTLYLETNSGSIEIGTRELSANNSIARKQTLAISGNRVAWDSYENNAPKIRYYNGTNTVELGDGVAPKLYQQGVVWSSEYQGIQYFNGQTTTLISDIPLFGSPVLKTSGNNIVWSGNGPNGTELFLYDGSTTKQITTEGYNIPARNAGPTNYEISGQKVIWTSFILDENGSINLNTEVYYYDGSQTQRLTNTAQQDRQFGFVQGVPVWGSFDADGNEQLFTYQNNQIQQLTTAQNNLGGNYKLIDGVLAWEHSDPISGQTDIYVYNGQNISQLTNTPESETLMSKSTDRIYWSSTAGEFVYNNGQVRELDLGSGTYNVLGGKQDNLLLQGNPDAAIEALDGVYRGTAVSEQQVKRGTANNDQLVGTQSSNIIYGLDGNDRLVGGNGTDNLYGGNGNDTIVGRDGDDLIFGNDGNDLLNGDGGNDILVGGAGADTLNGGLGRDRLFGGDGNDQINGGDGDDFINGGAGNDALRGGIGNDTIVGAGGIDTIEGGDGNDQLSTDGGEVYGGAGNDVINGSGAAIVARGGNGNDTINGTGQLYGDAGNDQISGIDGDDLLNGGDGNDSLSGGYGNDTILGGSGDDVLQGLFGNDLLTGGGGRDTFVFEGFGQSLDLGTDKITNFQVAEDKIQLVSASTSSVGNVFANGINFVAVANDSEVATSAGSIVYSKATGNLFYNQNGAAPGLGDLGVQFATLENRPQNLAAGNFTIG